MLEPESDSSLPSGSSNSRLSSLTSLSFVSLGSSALNLQVSSMSSLASSQACSTHSLRVYSPKSSKSNVPLEVPEDKAVNSVKTNVSVSKDELQPRCVDLEERSISN